MISNKEIHVRITLFENELELSKSEFKTDYDDYDLLRKLIANIYINKVSFDTDVMTHTIKIEKIL